MNFKLELNQYFVIVLGLYKPVQIQLENTS